MARVEMFQHNRVAVQADDGVSDIRPQRDWNGNSHKQQGILGFLGTAVTLASQAFVATDALHVVAASSGTSDTLATITTTNNLTNDWIQLLPHSGHTITVAHGTGNIFLQGGVSKILSPNVALILRYDGSNWYEWGSYLGAITSAQNTFTQPQIIILPTSGSNSVPTDAVMQLVSDSTHGNEYNDAYGTIPAYILRRADGTLASPTALLSGDEIGKISVRGFDGTSFVSSAAARMAFFAAENWTHSSALGTYISFYTTKKTTTTSNEVFRLSDDGTIKITNPAFTHFYILTSSAITADRILNLPLITGTDTLACLGLSQTFTGTITLNALTLGGQMNVNGQTFLNTGTITLPTTTTTLAGLAVAATWTAAQTFTTGLLKVADIADANGNLSIAVSATASAVDYITVVNAATANPANVQIQATGSDSNIGIKFVPKGTGEAFGVVETFVFPLGDESTNKVAGTYNTYYVPRAGKIMWCYVMATVAPTTAALTLDVAQNGTSIFSTKPSIAATKNTSNQAGGNNGVLTSTPLTISQDDKLEFKVNTNDTGLTSAGVKIVLGIMRTS